MKSSFKLRRRGTYRALMAVLMLVAVAATLPRLFRSQAYVSETKQGNVTRSYDPAIPNYDIRLDKSREAMEARNGFRQRSGKGQSELDRVNQNIAEGIEDLGRRVPYLDVEFSYDLGAPEVIGIDVLKNTFLTGPSSVKRDVMVKSFLDQNKSLYGLTSEQVSQLVTVANYTNPSGNLSYVDLQQQINGIPMFRGEVRAMITPKGEIARMINNLAPGLDYDLLSRNSGDPASAVAAAAGYINHHVTNADLQVSESIAERHTVIFERGQFADPTMAELMYFPLEPGVATLAWRVLLWENVAAYYVVVDAQTGQLLWRSNCTADQTQSATYGVYTDDSPSPLSPSNALPGSGIQGAGVSRSTLTLIGTENGNPGMNNLGWIPDGSNVTDGNNVEAGPDLVAPDGVDAPVAGSPNRVFNFAYNPPPLGAEAPTLTAYLNGATANLFYWTNRYHDILYSVGFTEPARNYQNDNFGRGGLAGDRIRAEVHDSGGTNNANFNPVADGVRGRMQMYLFTGPSPQRDGSLDGDVFIHELTHGLSLRLIGNSTGLNNNRGGSMGEGWSDFYARMLLSTSDEDINGIYAAGAYVTLNFQTVGTNNYYYGIRRFPYALKTVTGGPMNRPHNPLTFADIDPAQINTSDGAYAQASWISNSATEVHSAGEVWCMMLLEVRARIIQRMGFAAGNQRMLQLTTDAMKVTPTGPTFTAARDAILAADQASFGGADTGDIWAGFATRGAGFGASDSNANSAVVQSFNLPNILTGNVTVSDAVTGNNNGANDPGETVAVTVPLQNPLSTPINNVTATIGGNTQNYGDIPATTTVTRTFNYTIPAGQACGSTLVVPIDINGSAGAVSTTFSILIGAPIIGLTQNFDALTAPNLPAGWTTAITGSGTAWVSSTTTPDTAPNAIFTSDPATTSTSEVVTDNIPVTAANAGLQFRLNYSTEATFDGTVLEISIGGGAFQDILAAGGTFAQNGYNGPLGAGTNPLAGRQAWSGSSGGYVTVKVNLPAAANGQNIKLKFRHGSDTGTSGAGTRIDGIQIINGYNCVPVSSNKAVADFDNDGKTDVSVFRSGVWYVQRSTAGFLAQPFGLASDKIVPGDYDGDGKTDIAVFRTSTWYILKSSDGSVQTTPWGASGDIPMTGDYDGDGKADVTVYRPSNNTFYVLRSSDGAVAAQTWGIAGDVPVAGNFDGDSKTDYAVFRSGTWHVLGSTAGYSATPFGIAGDRLAPGDYDGDHKTDFAVFRSGTWYVLRSTAGLLTQAWGSAGDQAAPGDYDGDGKTDIAVFRDSVGTWYILNSGGGTTTTPFGTTGDAAVPAGYLP